MTPARRSDMKQNWPLRRPPSERELCNLYQATYTLAGPPESLPRECTVQSPQGMVSPHRLHTVTITYICLRLPRCRRVCLHEIGGWASINNVNVTVIRLFAHVRFDLT
jgi:hypothetical protein